jgi:hypothetical protein
MTQRTVSTFRAAAKYARRIGRDLCGGGGAISLPCKRHLRLGYLRGRGFTGHGGPRGRSTASGRMSRVKEWPQTNRSLRSRCERPGRATRGPWRVKPPGTRFRSARPKGCLHQCPIASGWSGCRLGLHPLDAPPWRCARNKQTFILGRKLMLPR